METLRTAIREATGIPVDPQGSQETSKLGALWEWAALYESGQKSRMYEEAPPEDHQTILNLVTLMRLEEELKDLEEASKHPDIRCVVNVEAARDRALALQTYIKEELQKEGYTID